MDDTAAAQQTLAYEIARELVLTRRADVSARLGRARASGDMVAIQEQLAIGAELRHLSIFDFGNAIPP